MHATIKTLLENRTSTGRYESGRALDDARIGELVRLATLAPSAFNAQNWSFVAVRTEAAKRRLRDAAFGQQQVVDAAVTFIVCGTLAMHESLPGALRPAVEAGVLPSALAEGWVEMVTTSHRDNPQLQRDEAFRSASLAAMTLMVAAQGMGLASGAMSGFDSRTVSEAFDLAPEEVPVMLVTIGYAADGNWPQKPRRPVQEVMRLA